MCDMQMSLLPAVAVPVTAVSSCLLMKPNVAVFHKAQVTKYDDEGMTLRCAADNAH